MQKKHPIVSFDVSEVFHSVFVYNRKMKPDEKRKLKLCKNRLERQFRKKEKKIMSALHDLFGSTTEKEIRVWILDNMACKPSISMPLFVKCRFNPDFMLYILVHELAHRYLEYGIRWKGKKSAWLKPGIKLEALCHYAAEETLGIDFVEELHDELINLSKYRESSDFIGKNRNKIKKFLAVAN